MKNAFPQFKAYACEGDSINWSSKGFDLSARLVYDQETKPTDFDCHSPMKIKQWCDEQWFFVGVVISVSKNDILLSDHCASLWGIECNYNDKSNKYLSEVALELEAEAISSAKKRVTEVLEALQ